MSAATHPEFQTVLRSASTIAALPGARTGARRTLLHLTLQRCTIVTTTSVAYIYQNGVCKLDFRTRNESPESLDQVVNCALCSGLALADSDAVARYNDADGGGAHGPTAANGGGVARRRVRHRGGGLRGARLLRWPVLRPRRLLPNDAGLECRTEDRH